jgi:D-3-phosphoglycerate dehydrogenase
VTQREKVPVAELCELIKDYDGLIVRSGTKVTKEIIDAGSRLRMIGRAGTGVDNIDVDAATMRGIMVMNTPGGNTVSAAELSVSLLMALTRNIPNATASLKAGRWDRKLYMGTELNGKTIGIVGLGQIGRKVAQMCQGLGMTTIGYDPIISKDVARSHNIESVEMSDIYKRSDFISLHTPLIAATKDLFNDDTLGQCKTGVMIVNCARGGIINEDALLRGRWCDCSCDVHLCCSLGGASVLVTSIVLSALSTHAESHDQSALSHTTAVESGKVAGAALDVYASEPPPESTKSLLAHPSIICTPHLGASTEEAQDKVAREIATQFTDGFAGRRIAGVVNSRILGGCCDCSCHVHLCFLLCCSLGGATALVTFLRVLCTLRTQISRINMYLYILQRSCTRARTFTRTSTSPSVLALCKRSC